MTNRLLLHSPRLVRTLYPATAAMAVLAALTVTVMVLRENGDGWQLFAIFVILALLGEVLAPILDRYAASDEEPSERLLGTVGGVSVLAVRGDRGAVRIGTDEIPLRDDERVVVRANA
jgi:hypothetical protein